MDVNELLPQGNYRIVVAHLGKIGPEALTRQEGKGVTILPPGVLPDSDQIWTVTPLRNGNVTITRPSIIRPTLALTHEGEPKAGSRVVQHALEFPTEWHVGIAPGFRQSLRLAHTELGIVVAPHKINPPFLELGTREELFWVFIHVK